MKGYSFRSLTDLVLKIFKTKVNAGTGLSGGGSLEADRTLTVKYGTAVGTAAQGNDSRLSNSREWTAATISQAETEAGTESTRRAFTAQRVRQAIVAWWNSVTGVFGRDLVTSADNTVARDKLGLFTSALRWPTWAEVSNKPTTFTPSSHTHPWSQITGQPVTATRWPSLAEVTGTPANYPTTWNSVAAKPAQATRWPSFTEVTGKPSTYTPSTHTHPVSQVTGLGTAATKNVGVNRGELVIAGTPTAIAALDSRVLDPSSLGGNFDKKAAFFFTSRGGLVSGTGNNEYGDFLALDTYSDASGGTINGLFFKKNGGSGIELFRASKGDTNWTSVGTLYHSGNMPTTATRWPTWAEVTGRPVLHTPIGVSQTWQRVTSSRSIGTTYTNTTGRTIVVSVTTNSKAGVYMDARVSGVLQFAHNSYTNQLLRPSVLLIVPAGNTYRVTSNSSLHTWAELR